MKYLSPLNKLLRSDKTIFFSSFSGKTILIENKIHTILSVVDLTQIKLQNEFIQQQTKLHKWVNF